MNVPDRLRYTADHEWVLEHGSVLRVGITDYAQDALGDVVFVQLPTVGTATRSGDPVGEIESTKSVSDVFAPVTGVVVAINTQLAEQPGLLNHDPYGDGWMYDVALADHADLSHLLDAPAYRDLVGA